MEKTYLDERNGVSARFNRALVDDEGNGGGGLDGPVDVAVDLSSDEKVRVGHGVGASGVGPQAEGGYHHYHTIFVKNEFFLSSYPGV